MKLNLSAPGRIASPTDATPFLRHIEALNRHDPGLYLPFVMAGRKVGMVRKDKVDLLRAYPETFRIDTEVSFLVEGGSDDRSQALDRVVRDLAARGAFAYRGEAYRVTVAWGEEVPATIDRGAYNFFGVSGFGVHVNGLVARPDGLHLWIARRSADLMVAPGKLDNIIGGGLGAGYGAYQTMIKEAGEEAGLSPAIAGQAVPVGAISYACDSDAGLKRDTLFVYDLYLPEDLTPETTDGEVERFELLPVETVAALVCDTNDFKSNVNLVIADLLVRHGYLAPDMAGYAALEIGLRRS